MSGAPYPPGKVVFNFLSVSCQKIAVNWTALGEDTLVFPNGKLMTKHQTRQNGFEYEVGINKVEIPHNGPSAIMVN